MLTFFVSVVSVVIGVFYIWAKWKLSYWQRRGVPTLPTNIFFGNFKDTILMRISPGFLLGRLHNEANENDRYLGIYIFQKPFLLIRDPKLMKHILIKDFSVFSNRLFSFKNPKDLIGTRNLFSMDGPEWRYLRTKLSPAFTSGKLKQLFNLMRESSDSLGNFLEENVSEGQKNKTTIDMKDASSKYTTDIISTLAFGVRTNSFAKPTPEFYTRSRLPFTMTVWRAFKLFTIFFFPKLANKLNSSFLESNTEYFRNVFWRSMDLREKSNSERGDVMDTLLKLKNEKQEAVFRFEGDELLAQSVIFFIAGLETSSVTISFCLWELAKHPEIQERVRNEILDNLKNGGLTYESVLAMKYLMQVINETLRMYPPAPIIDRVAEQDYKIPDSDVIIEKGTAIYTALPGIQMDPKYHPNPEVFDPERFSEERKNDIEPCTFMPFGEGPRICIGMRIGLLQAAVGVIRVIQNYRVSLNPAHKIEISNKNAFTAPKDGVRLYIEKYKP